MYLTQVSPPRKGVVFKSYVWEICSKQMWGMKENRRRCDRWVFSFSRYSCIIAFSPCDFILIEKWTLFISFLLPVFCPSSFVLLLISSKFFRLLLFFFSFSDGLNWISPHVSYRRLEWRAGAMSAQAQLISGTSVQIRGLVLTNLNGRLIFRFASSWFEITGTLPAFFLWVGGHIVEHEENKKKGQ